VKYNVVFQPSGCRGAFDEGKNLLEASRELGVDITAPCGGAETCGKCKVKIEEGLLEGTGIDSKMASLSPITQKEISMLKPEEINDGCRLACCTSIMGDVAVFIPEQSRSARQVILETGKERAFTLNPAVRKYYLEMEKPTLEDCRDDLQRMNDALKSGFPELVKGVSIDYPVLKTLPGTLRKGGWKITVTLWNNTEIIAVEPGRTSEAYGAALDIGTTTIAAYLCDLATGEVLKRDSTVNSQVRYGDDVISRITYCMMNEGGLEKLHQLVLHDINSLILRMADSMGIDKSNIYEAVLVFNTAMHHIALNIDPQYVGRAPFTSAVSKPVDLKAREIGISICESGNIHCLPVEAGFVGADNVSVLISEEPYKQDKMILVVDIGTNGEIDLGNRHEIFSASCATGPALEGAQIKFGMRAAPGAIERITIDPYTLKPEIKVIGENHESTISNPAAKGICGSGIIDAAAELFKTGIILPDGRFNSKLDSPRVRRGSDGKYEYVLVWADETSINQDITITQKDIRAVQLAKAALYAGAKILMKKRGIDKIDGVVLAGAFGSYINKESALLIGMFPDCDPENVTAVGNAAGEGAKLALMDIDKRREAEEAARFVQFVETAAEPDFQEHFYSAMSFPHSKDKFLHIQKILDSIPVSETKITRS